METANRQPQTTKLFVLASQRLHIELDGKQQLDLFELTAK